MDKTIGLAVKPFLEKASELQLPVPFRQTTLGIEHELSQQLLDVCAPISVSNSI